MQHPMLTGGYESAKTKKLYSAWAKINGHDRPLSTEELRTAQAALRLAKESEEADLLKASRKWMREVKKRMSAAV